MDPERLVNTGIVHAVCATKKDKKGVEAKSVNLIRMNKHATLYYTFREVRPSIMVLG